MNKGLLMVFTGNGKGKTTSALGLTLRTVGHGRKVCFIQFIKGTWKYGELDAVKQFPDLIEFHVLGKGMTWKSNNLEKNMAVAQGSWNLAEEAILSGRYSLVVLDELTYMFKYKMLDLAPVLKAIENRPEGLHVVVTGRNAPEELVAAADLVTEMREVKHPLKAGIKAQKGVEF